MDSNQAVRVLRDRIEKGRAVLDGEEPFERWRSKSRITLERIYGPDHSMLKEWEDVRYTLAMWTDTTPDSAFRRARDAGINKAINLLEAAIFDLEELVTPTEVNPEAFDPELWEHVAHDVEGEHWDKVPAGVATFVESKVRVWAGLSASDYGKDLMLKVFKPDGGVLPCGDPMIKGEQQGWQQLATGFVQALSNVDRHRIQERADAQTYAIGVLGVGSLLLTQLRHQHAERFET